MGHIPEAKQRFSDCRLIFFGNSVIVYTARNKHKQAEETESPPLNGMMNPDDMDLFILDFGFPARSLTWTLGSRRDL